MFRKESKTTDKKKFTDAKDIQINDTLNLVFNAMKEKGYNPYTQLACFMMTEDDSYVTNYNNARKLLLELDREEIIKHILGVYFEN